MRSFLFGLMCWFATEQVCQMERCYSDCLCRISTTNNNPKNPQFCRPLVKGGGFRKKTGGIVFNKALDLRPIIECKQNVSQSLSQLPLTALFTKESRAVRWVWNVDLQPNKCNKEPVLLKIIGL